LSAAALLLADGRTPSGTHAHSGGLEAAVAEGLGVAGVAGFLRGRLHTVAFTDAALSAAAVRAGDRIDSLLALDREALARTPSPRLRAASATLGRSILRTGATLYPGHPALKRYRERSAHTPRAVAFGVVAGAAGLSAADAALVALHDDAASVAAAAVKLLPIDAAAASAWVAGLAGELAGLAARAAGAGELPSLSAPLVELRSVRRADTDGSLFAS
jgi:urease accessory protein